MRKTFLYILRDPRTKKIRYLGKSNNPRMRLNCHIRDARENPTSHHRRAWIRGLLNLGLRPEIEILCSVNFSEWEFWEKKFIAGFREEGIDLLNVSEGGEGTSLPGPKHGMWGRTHTPEAREKIRNSKIGKPRSPESRIKQSRTVKITAKRNSLGRFI